MEKVHVVRIDPRGGGTRGDRRRPRDIVVWVPTKGNVKAKIKFKQGQSPFDAEELPAPNPGDPVRCDGRERVDPIDDS